MYIAVFMGRTLETKRKILNLLKKKEMTITELSRELDLSSTTVSQHINELQQNGAIEKVDNEHFRKLKYYRITEPQASSIAANYVKYLAVTVTMILIASLIYLYRGAIAVPSYSSPRANGVSSTTVQKSNTSTAAVNSLVTPVISGMACPMLTYMLNGSIANYSRFKLYYLNYSNGKIADYVMASNSTGNLYVNEAIHSLASGNGGSSIQQTRTHYAYVSAESQNALPANLNVSISPLNYMISNRTVSSIVTISANSAVANSTYIVRIDGPCGGGVTPILITVGQKPYNGTVTLGAGIYA